MLTWGGGGGGGVGRLKLVDLFPSSLGGRVVHILRNQLGGGGGFQMITLV